MNFNLRNNIQYFEKKSIRTIWVTEVDVYDHGAYITMVKRVL